MATEWEDWVLKEFLRVAEAAVSSGYGNGPPEELLKELQGANYDGLKAALKAAEDEWRRRLDVAETEAIRWERSAERVAEELVEAEKGRQEEIKLRRQVQNERDALVEAVEESTQTIWDGAIFYG